MVTIGEVYGPAMQIKTQEEADAYLEKVAQAHAAMFDGNLAQAKAALRSNLAYYAGYYDAETRARIERLFKCEHPYFGAIAEKGQPTPEEAFAMGKELGERKSSEE